MKITDFLEKILFNGKNEFTFEPASSSDEDYTVGYGSLLWAYRLALSVATERIGALISKCEIKTYIRGEETKADNWYLFNIEPNCNQSAAEFKKQIIRKLILNPGHDCLIVELSNIGRKKSAFYVADDFTKDDSQLYDSIFKNVSVDVYEDGGFTMQGVFTGNKAIYLKYQNAELNGIFSDMRRMYEYLVKNAMMAGSYRQKYVLSMDQTAEAQPNFEEHMQSLLNDQFKAFMEGQNAVLPLYSGMKVDQLSAGSDLGQNVSTANKNVDTQIDECLTKVGLAFNIPKSIMLGDFEADDLEHMLTYCIDPMAALIEQGINRKYYGQSSVTDGTYVKMDTMRARHVDFVSVGTSASSAISSGVFSINDMRKKMGEAPLKDDLGDLHFITRNYAALKDSFFDDPTNVIAADGSADGTSNSPAAVQKKQEENDEQKESEDDDK